MKNLLIGLASAVLLSHGGQAVATVPEDEADLCSSQLSAGIPARPPDAPTGSEFVRQVWDFRGRERDQAILDEIGRGNVPGFLRRLKPVKLSFRDRRGVRHDATICVTPDYLAVGSDDDFVRVPLGLRGATDVARGFRFTLPTRKIVDAIYQQASLRLSPRPMKPGPQMVSTRYFLDHNGIIERQRGSRPAGELVSGHKKDVILTKRLLTKRGRVAIYGWHQKPGRPIQPLSTVHGARYADYSHGVRLVSDTLLLDGSPRSIYEVLRERTLAGVLTYEGTIRDAARLMGLESSQKTTSD